MPAKPLVVLPRKAAKTHRRWRFSFASFFARWFLPLGLLLLLGAFHVPSTVWAMLAPNAVPPVIRLEVTQDASGLHAQAQLRSEAGKPLRDLPVRWEFQFSGERMTVSGTSNAEGQAQSNLPERLLQPGQSVTIVVRAGPPQAQAEIRTVVVARSFP